MVVFSFSTKLSDGRGHAGLSGHYCGSVANFSSIDEVIVSQLLIS